MEEAYFAEQIIFWYQKHQRKLPWRNTKDPYAIWLSEIILQQTRVAQGLPYYQKFIRAYPSVKHLASAPPDEVLRLWQGLGYYSRARNLHACAKAIVEQYGGKFPDNYLELLKLKGVGAYTAAAIASFAYNETVAVVDGNVYRVLSRVFGVQHDILSTKGQKMFKTLANSLVPRGQASVYNQAIMEFGALQCTPATPACLLCPLNTMCYAYQHGMQKQLPVKVRKIKVKQRFLYYLVGRQAQQIFMKQRTAKDIWKGLYDFYLVEDEKDLELEALAAKNDVILRLLSLEPLVTDMYGPYKHQLTHQQLQVKFIVIEFPEGYRETWAKETDTSAYTLKEAAQLPKPILVANFLNEQIF